MDLSLLNTEITVSRKISDSNKIFLIGDVDKLNVTLSLDEHNVGYLNLEEWTKLLGQCMFGLKDGSFEKYNPSFRALISYFVRRRSGAFLNPFSYFSQQPGWSKQVNNALLQDLNWEFASKLQNIKDQEKVLDDLKKAINSGMLKGIMGGTIGELESQRVRVELQVEEFKKQLDSFKVHPQYKDIELKANELTLQIHSYTNNNIANRNLISHYENNMVEEKIENNIIPIFEEAKINFPDLIKKELSEVQEFHEKVVSNRQMFLLTEIDRLQKEINETDERIKTCSEKRAEYMSVLSEYGALDEYTKLQQKYVSEVSLIKNIDSTIENLKKFEKGKSSLKIKKEILQQDARNDYSERHNQRAKAIQYFNSNSQFLYSESGELLIDITKSGFKFDVKINKSGSECIDHMKVFCYDLMVAQIWSDKENAPGILVHDSTMFDPVDERQVHSAIELAKKESADRGFQYLCLINSDKVEISEGIESCVIRRLTDESETGGVLGFRLNQNS